VDAAGRLLACGQGAAVGDADFNYFDPTLVAAMAMAEVRVRSVAGGRFHSLALSSDGRVYSWGDKEEGQLGHGDELDRPSPVPIEGLQGVHVVAAAGYCSLAVTQSGIVFHWGESFFKEESSQLGDEDEEIKLRPVIVEGFGGVRVRHVLAGESIVFAIGEAGQLFSWGDGELGLLGHGDTQNQPSPKRIEALRGVRVSSVSVGIHQALALAEDGLVYTWGDNLDRSLLGHPNDERVMLPKPVEALRDVRVGSIAVGGLRSYAVADTGEVWAWGPDSIRLGPLGHGEQMNCLLPKPIESLRGIKVDAVAASDKHTLALADDGSVYTWGDKDAVRMGMLGLGSAVRNASMHVTTPQKIPNLRVACGL
jgi:alpha-tubulin suppressor-like RCC1 family protein